MNKIVNELYAKKKDQISGDAFSAGIWAASTNLALSNNSIKGVSTNFKALQARSNALGLGLNYSDEMLRAAKILRGIRNQEL